MVTKAVVKVELGQTEFSCSVHLDGGNNKQNWKFNHSKTCRNSLESKTSVTSLPFHDKASKTLRNYFDEKGITDIYLCVTRLDKLEGDMSTLYEDSRDQEMYDWNYRVAQNAFGFLGDFCREFDSMIRGLIFSKEWMPNYAYNQVIETTLRSCPFTQLLFVMVSPFEESEYALGYWSHMLWTTRDQYESTLRTKRPSGKKLLKDSTKFYTNKEAVNVILSLNEGYEKFLEYKEKMRGAQLAHMPVCEMCGKFTRELCKHCKSRQSPLYTTISLHL